MTYQEPPMAAISAENVSAVDRRLLVQQAFRIEWFTVGWMTIEAIVAVASALAAHSLSLLAFGIDSAIELVSAGVLLWRLTVELRHGKEFSEAAERAASRIGGGLLLALAAYVVAGAGWSLWQRQGEEFSLPGLVVAAIAIPAMYLLARAKLRLADQLGSRALRIDAIESAACGGHRMSALVETPFVVTRESGRWRIGCCGMR